MQGGLFENVQKFHMAQFSFMQKEQRTTRSKQTVPLLIEIEDRSDAQVQTDLKIYGMMKQTCTKDFFFNLVQRI